MKTRKAGRIVSTILLAVLFLAVMAPSAEAATKKVKTQAYSSVYSKKLHNKAKTITLGTNTLKITQSGYVKFKVPKSKKYTITYTGMSVKKGTSTYGYSDIYVPEMQPDKVIMKSRTFTTKGGKASTAWFGVEKYASTEKTTTAFLATRNAKLKLKKGTTVYIYINVGTNTTAKLNLIIK